MATKNSPAKGASAPVALTAIDPINHDGVSYAPGDDLPEMPADQAQALLDSGAAKKTAA